MANRSSFDKSLSELREDIKHMAGMTRDALTTSVVSLKQQDMALAEEVIQNDKAINAFEEKINEKAILLIAKEQPLATDLRKIIVSLKISSDIERIADFAVNVAKATKRIGDAELVKPIIHIPQMADLVNKMLTQAIDAYKYEDTKLAIDSSKIDDEVDALYKESITELIDIATEDNTHMEQIMQLAMICRYLERSGDHVTNISENTIYMVKGIKTDLNT
ncbi:phosphate signaling complex protein PhoU [Planococcus lenghuensis]|uniref:Phosphate-specific transport system accessory protein PhoU n=1 Tax=Planococcus lenghuensis TaxID=2213202 RepID=A0A1Q2KYG8_9BACL|nr:phosphate signaling complex protein PhoU [Planococcus lenghuensis]AQQ53193.1 phosphate transport system regulatory protein PhoU [Planococcus lenghuensis]